MIPERSIYNYKKINFIVSDRDSPAKDPNDLRTCITYIKYFAPLVPSVKESEENKILNENKQTSVSKESIKEVFEGSSVAVPEPMMVVVGCYCVFRVTSHIHNLQQFKSFLLSRYV